MERIVPRSVEQDAHLCRRQDGSLPMGELRGLRKRRDVPGNETVSNGISECSTKCPSMVSSCLSVQSSRGEPHVHHVNRQIGQTMSSECGLYVDSYMALILTPRL